MRVNSIDIDSKIKLFLIRLSTLPDFCFYEIIKSFAS